jgi:primosomal protein N'
MKLTVALEDRDSAEVEAARMAASLRERAAAQSGTPGAATPSHEVLGPVPAYIARRAGRWRFHVVVGGPDPVGILERDPGPPWSVDVDPESLL